MDIEKTKKYYLNKIMELTSSTDFEKAHYEADLILCDILRKVGFSEIVDLYECIYKCYA